MIRSQYLAEGRSRLGSVLSVQAKRSKDVMVVDVKSSSGGGRCRCFLFHCVTSCFGGSQFCIWEGRVVGSGAPRVTDVPFVASVTGVRSFALVSCVFGAGC